jgi:NAD(P)-dependent dehydrogenase (short-subunit alcohol dehydrogenase family)
MGDARDPGEASASGSSIRFDDRVVVITGAGRGLGRQHALELAARGARVVVNDLGGEADGGGTGSDKPALEVVDEIIAAGGQAIGDTNDVSTEAGADGLVEQAINAFGAIDVVVNNAGIGCVSPAEVDQISLETFHRYLRVNLDSAFLVTSRAWPHLKSSESGRVVMTTSTAGYFGFPGQLPYNTSKMGVVGLIRSLAVEGARHGIKVNGVAPSAYTRLVEIVAEQSPNPVMQRWLRTALGIEWVSPVVVWLASDECTVTGNDYDVAGGRVARLLISAETSGLLARPLTPEIVRDRLPEIHDEHDFVVIKEGRNHLGMLREILGDPSETS